MKKSILIYDSSHAYLAFMKRQFKDEYELSNYEKLDKKEMEVERFDAVIFIINNEVELIDLMYIFTKVKNLFISTSFKKLNQRLKYFENITIINLQPSKNQIAEQIRFYLNAFNDNNQNRTPNLLEQLT